MSVALFLFQSGPLSDIIPAFLASENAVFASNNWRLQEMLMNNLSCLNKCYSSENIYNKVIPILRQKLIKAVRYHSLNESCQFKALIRNSYQFLFDNLIWSSCLAVYCVDEIRTLAESSTIKSFHFLNNHLIWLSC